MHSSSVSTLPAMGARLASGAGAPADGVGGGAAGAAGVGAGVWARTSDALQLMITRERMNALGGIFIRPEG